MPVIEQKILNFTSKEIWFEPSPKDIQGTDKVIYRNCTENTIAQGFNKEPFTTLTIDLTAGADAVFKNFNKTCQNQIRKGLKHGIVLKDSGAEKEFCKLYKNFTAQKGIITLPITPEFLNSNGLLFTAFYENELIAGSYFLSNGTIMRLYINASKRFNSNSKINSSVIGYASRLLIWRAIEFGCENNFKEFDLGGYYTGEAPDIDKEKINFFKEGFTKNVVTRYNYTKYYSKPMKLLSSLAGLLKRQ